MARIIYGALVTEIKGSIGGTTFQSNAYGFTVKNKPRQKKPKTELQNRSKIYMGAAAQAWSTIGATGRSEWDAWAAANPQYAKNNPTAVLSGYAVFVRVLQQKYLRDGDIADFTVSPSYTIVPMDTGVFTLTRDGATLSFGRTWVTADGAHRVNFFMSQPFRPSVNSVGSRTRYVLNAFVEDDATDIADEYNALYGGLPEVGDKIFIENVQYNDGNGMVYGRQRTSVEVLAP